ncbi:hypothetical protein T459_04132 [Capsicum annuum]|uniref:F-box associated beta-propeller type 3 domain-containing protein n=1 Tax=Capsicum annuum TaxID=4072 RepID=A0A2G3A452_CAPAN|nr:hypothetical protein T459_04132 [Capsicum annuum]
MEFPQADYMNDDSEGWDDNSPTIFKGFSSAITTQRHGLEKLADYGFKIDAYQNHEFPTHIIREGDKKIKDVVKEHVLPFLPAKSLMRFKAVSKEWDKWIACPLLSHQQSFSCKSFSGYFCQDMKMEWDTETMFLSLDHSTSGVPCPALDFLPEAVKILSSCSGLLLCQGSEKYYVCNPASQDWKMLPLPQCYHGEEPAVALAFEPSLRNIEAYYHVICAFPMLGQPIIGFEIYSSESNTWSCSSAYCTDIENPRLVGGGFYMNGVAYYETKSNEVLAFDVKVEIPAIISLPDQVGRRGSLTQMEGELCYVAANNECGNVFLIDIYQGMEMILKRTVSVTLGPDRSFTQACKVLPCVNSDAVAIHSGQYIHFYHISEQKVESIASSFTMGHGKKFLPYTNSLAMLHELKEP